MLFSKKLLNKEMARFTFPTGDELQKTQKLITGWQKSLKESNLDKTKEKSVQGNFIVRFFSDILGYASQMSGEVEWQLIQHPTTEVDADEADGALGIFSKESSAYHAVIELKDAHTPLDKRQLGRRGMVTPVEQAFGYLTKFDRCDWVIVSNFREIRLYHKSRGQGLHETFDVLKLHEEEEFKRFFFLLCRQNLVDKNRQSVVDRLTESTVRTQEEITDNFYRTFKAVRLELFAHIVENNLSPTLPKKILLEKTQKLLDRMVFVLFCEDSADLLPRDMVQTVYDNGIKSRERSDQRVWREFKHLFIDIDEGRADVDPPINAYDGGLFARDEVLENLIIKDDIWASVKRLSAFDFESELDVNILGHIFEQSLTDLEQLKAEIDGKELAPTKTKRKKEGVFYTPPHITRHIVEETVGRFLDEHPDTLGTVSILDPACGSGAFLNQAHEFLREQYRARNEERIAQVAQGGQLAITHIDPAETDKGILLNNLFGVDLNAESVEITKLSLWLKTARKDRKLENLNRNIRRGNSLISDPAVAGPAAFDWEKQFPGGFDCIVGNPPYVFAREKMSDKEKDYYIENFRSAKGELNTFILFIERALSLLKNGGYLGFIIPNSLLKLSSTTEIRRIILEQCGVREIVNLHGFSFPGVNVETVICILKKGEKTAEVQVADLHEGESFEQIVPRIVSGSQWIENDGCDFDVFVDDADIAIIEKMRRSSQPLSINFEVKAGLKAYEAGKGTPAQTPDDVKRRPYDCTDQLDENTHRYLDGDAVGRYHLSPRSDSWLRYGPHLAAPRTFDLFTRPRILAREIVGPFPFCLKATYAEDIFLNNLSIINVLSRTDNREDLLYLLALLNGKALSFYFMKTNPKANRRMFPKLILEDLRNFPVPAASAADKKTLVAAAEWAMALSRERNGFVRDAVDFFAAEFKPKKITEKLKSFFSLGWNEFADELQKQKVSLSLERKEELMRWLKEKTTRIGAIDAELARIDNEIDKISYRLYGLTAQEYAVIDSFGPRS